MNRFERVVEILDHAVNDEDIGAHGAFWRTLSRDQFVAKVVYGKKLVVLNDGPNSNLIRALRGLPPFGRDVGQPTAQFRRMPGGFPAVAVADIDFIETWINDGCPEDPLP